MQLIQCNFQTFELITYKAKIYIGFWIAIIALKKIIYINSFIIIIIIARNTGSNLFLFSSRVMDLTTYIPLLPRSSCYLSYLRKTYSYLHYLSSYLNKLTTTLTSNLHFFYRKESTYIRFLLGTYLRLYYTYLPWTIHPKQWCNEL